MFQHPEKTLSHQTLILLQERTLLSSEERATLKRNNIGFEGEMRFAQLLHHALPKPASTLYSINLEMKGSESQFDCIYLTRHKLYHFEVKNYQGDYYVEHDKWFYGSSEKEIRNPLHQLNRSQLILQEFFSSQGIFIPVESYIVFIHPHFHLYQSRMQDPIIYHSQLNRFIKQLQSSAPMQIAQQQHIKHALIKAHKKVSKYDQKPVYNYHSLDKGLYCKDCYKKSNHMDRTVFECTNCGYSENVGEALARHVDVLRFLFPDIRVSVPIVYDWCGGLFTKRQIRYFLTRNYILKGRGKSSYYVK